MNVPSPSPFQGEGRGEGRRPPSLVGAWRTLSPALPLKGGGGSARRFVFLILAAIALPAQAPAPTPVPRAAQERPPLPADKSTHHQITLPTGTLRFTATAGAIRLTDAEGKPQADVAFTAFTLDGADPLTRPVTIAFNGGPGASSAWLNLGAVGPWRVPFGGATLSPSAAPVLVDNAETWLDLTDLVFLDPPGTGWSRTLNEDARKRAWSVSGDISMLADVSRRWLEANHRLVSPKLVMGESYGGFRGPRLVQALRSEQGVGVGGLVLVSPVLDFSSLGDGWDPLPWVERLPSLAAAARGVGERQADAEAYATDGYLPDLLRGVSDKAAVARIVDHLTRLLPGVDAELIRRRAGRLDIGTFLRERQRGQGRIGSPYDSGIGSADPFPEAADESAPDPVLEPLRAVLTSAAYAMYARRLDWLPAGKYEILNNAVARQWDWGRGRSAPSSVGALRRALALDPSLRVMVAHGIADLVTPYFASKIVLDQVPATQPPGRLRLHVYPGGHMFYSQDASRAAFHRDGAALVSQVVPAGGPAGAAAAGTPPPASPPAPAAGTSAPRTEP